MPSPIAFLVPLTLASTSSVPFADTPSTPVAVDPVALVGLAPQEDATAAAVDAESTEDLERRLAKGGSGDVGELAATLSNPIADLVSLPLQLNWDTGIGPKNADRLTLNVQPVVPISISEEWNLISRTILPVVYADSPADGVSSEFGLGDTVQSLFFSPVDPIGGWIIGAGPVILFPTGTEDLFRSRQWGLGPTIVALRQSPIEGGTLTYGALLNHIWKIDGSDRFPDVNATFIQPFLSYAWPTGFSLTVNSETTYDWTGESWNVPINLIAGQVMRFGDQTVQLSFGGRWYADSPEGGAEWGLRAQLTFLFPK